MKVEVFRQSGQITDDEAQKKFNADWAPIFDQIMVRADEIHAQPTHRLYMLPKHIITKRMCDFMERQLFKKYSVPVTEEIPKTGRQWKTLMTKYGAPLMMAGRSDNNKMVLIVMDTLNG